MPSPVETAENTLREMRLEKERISALVVEAKEIYEELRGKPAQEEFDVRYGITKQAPAISAHSKLLLAKVEYNDLVVRDYDLGRRIMKQMDRIKRLQLRPGE